MTNEIDYPKLSRQLRVELKWSHAELARRAKVDTSTIVKIEKGTRRPSLKLKEKLRRLARRHGIVGTRI